mgnify:CR=1 FL=1
MRTLGSRWTLGAGLPYLLIREMEEDRKLVRVNLEDIGKKIGNRIDFYRFLREKCKPKSLRQHLLA